MKRIVTFFLALVIVLGMIPTTFIQAQGARSSSATQTTKCKITTQPKAQSVSVGGKAKFSVVVTGSGLTYRWQYRNASGGSWTNTSQSGYKTNKLTVATKATNHGYQYRCKITDKYGNVIYTNAAKLTVKPAITTQPAAKTVSVGTKAKFTVAATGSGLTYRWQYRNASGGSWTNTSQSGYKTNKLTVATKAINHGYQYRCKITDKYGNVVYTKAAKLTVKSAITTQPASVTVAGGSAAKVTVKAVGNGLTYKWYYKNRDASNFTRSTTFTGNSYNVSMNCTRDGRQVYCVIMDRYGNKVITKTVTLAMKKQITTAGHKFGAWRIRKEATTTSTGLKERKCSICGTKETKVIPIHTHNYIKEMIKKATCASGGYTTYKCSSCGHSYTGNYTAQLDHDYDIEIVKAACTAGGYVKYTCSRCKDSYKESETNAKGHSYNVVSNTVTCTSNGIKTEECDRCGNKKTTSIKAPGHTVKTETQDAVCGNDGYVYKYCTVCEEEISYTAIPATGEHKYTTRVVADVVKEQMANNNYIYQQYNNCTDWLVNQCSECGHCVMDDMYFRYTDYEAANIMLGYVNNLRAEVYGTHDYDLTLDSTLLELAKMRSQAIVNDFSHNGVPSHCAENIVKGGSLYNHFLNLKNSSGHYENMINKEFVKFAYAIYIPGGSSDYYTTYGVQLFRR